MKNLFKHFFVQFVSILACLAIVGAVMLVVRPRLGGKEGADGSAEAAQVEHEPGVNVEMDEFTVNLADTDQNRFLKITVVLVVASAGGGGGHGGGDGDGLAEFTPQVRHAMIMTLTRQYYHALQSPEGKAQLKEQLKEHANEALKPAGIAVIDILFTEFVMQ